MGDSTPLDESDDNYLKIFEEYSFPVDLVVRRRGRTVRNSFDELEDVTISDEYCDPSDFKAYCQPGDESVTKLYTAPDPHDYTQPCPDTEPPSSEEENDYEYIGVPDDTLWSRVVEECPCPDSAPPVRGPEPPSPVYENVTYIVIGDRAPFRSSEAPDWPHSPMAQHWISFLRERQTRDRSKKDKREGHGVSWLRRLCHRSHSDGILHKNELDRSLQRSEECLEKKASEPRGRVLQRSQSVAVETDRGQGGGLEQVLRKESRSLDAILEDEGSSGKSNQLYETAFESTAGPVEAGMQDELLNHPVLHMSPDSSQSSQADPAACGRGQAGSRSEQLRKLFADRSVSRGSSASDLSSPSIVQKVVNESSKLSRPTEVSLKRSLPIDTTLSTPSPPSTAPLPIKFRDKKFTVIRSTPNLCSVPAGPKGAESPMSIDMNHIIRPVIPSLEEHRVPMTSRVTLLRQNRPVSTSSSTLSSLESLRSTKSDESSVSRPISGLSSDSSCSSLNNSLLTTPPVKPPRRSLLGTREADRYRHKKPSPIIEDVSREVESEVRNFPGFEADSCPEGIKRSASRSLIGSLVTNWDSNKDVQGSDSGISVEFQQGPTPEVFSELALDRLRRKVALIDKAPSEEDTDVDNLPFDMPKLRRRRNNSLKTELSVDRQMGETDKPNKTSLTLSFSAISPKKTKTGLQLNLSPSNLYLTERIDLTLPLERQGWYHGAITRVDAENLLRVLKEGSYLVRNSESSRQGYSLSLKSVRGFMHMRIVRDPNTDKFILGQFSKPFENIPEMIVHYSRNKLPIKGAEHMSLVHPVVGQLL